MKLVVFASGTGSNFVALSQHFQITSLVCDQPDAPVIERAQERNIPVHVVARHSGESRQAHEERIWRAIENEEFHVVCLAGYYRLLSPWFLGRFPKKSVINIHPSLLPAYPGLGSYEKAHVAGEINHGITVHYVDEGMDSGEVIQQARLEHRPVESLESFKQRGLKLEHQIYPLTLIALAHTSHFYRVEVLPKDRSLLNGKGLKSRLYWVKSAGPLAQLEKIAREILSDAVAEDVFLEGGDDYFARLASLGLSAHGTDVGFHPGVTDNAGATATQAFKLFGHAQVEIRSGYCVRGRAVEMNPLLEWQSTWEQVPQPVWSSAISEPQPVRSVDLAVSEQQLLELNQHNWWALSLSELKVVRDFFLTQSRQPTDVEMEIIAQTWSEHCKHKIFRATIHHQDDQGARTIHSLFASYIKGATDRVVRERKLDWLMSVFHDNAGVVRWDKHLDIAVKVETHNSPSALDPYGGALTGILGVNRDILGVGMGARPIANTNVFCLGPEGLHERLGTQWPPELKSPEVIRAGVHAGVRDGGNKSGIPTVNGAFHYDVNYAGKPLVYCGTIGIMPHEVQGLPGHQKRLAAGDWVVMVGGRVGKDGLHGATFSSMEWKEGTPASVVQIGDPLTQKRMTDFILEARDLGLYSAITDNGAGGLSSSVGEMAQLSHGADIDLSKVPLKYPGLSPCEIMVSESQERMTLAVPPKDWEALAELASRRGVEVSCLGEFTSSGFLRVSYDGEEVAKLPLSFLHEGLPPMELKSHWHQLPWQDWCEAHLRLEYPGLKSALLSILASPNIRSHEKWVRQYDHEVQAASVTKPFSAQGTPTDAGVISMAIHGGEENQGIAVASGLAPQLSRWDARLMALASVDEAVRNAVCAGADPARMCLLDNFCWPDPLVAGVEGEEKLAQLVRACEGLYDTCVAYGMPLVSGKDSMKNDAKVKFPRELKISVLPTLLVTAVGHVPDLKVCPPSAPRLAGLQVGWLPSLGGTTALTLSTLFQVESLAPQEVSSERLMPRYRGFHQAIRQGLIHSAHDVSEGGLLAALAETTGPNCGWQIQWQEVEDKLFHEGVGMILFTTSDWESVMKLLPEAQKLGLTTSECQLVVNDSRWTHAEIRSALGGA